MIGRHPAWMLVACLVLCPVSSASARQGPEGRPEGVGRSPDFGEFSATSTASSPPPPGHPGPWGRSPRPGGLLERLGAPLSHVEDDDGRINTDRPSFTPSNATVPAGRLQVESGYTFSHDLTRTSRNDEHLFPELAVRLGLKDWLELRTFWAGQTYSRTNRRADGALLSRNDGPTNFLAGFKWKLSDQDRWIPEAALITDLAIPTSGTSPNSSDGIEPVLFLLYGWKLTDRFTLAGSTGLTTVFDRGVADAPLDDAFEQFSQSLIGFLSVRERVTLFSEWFVLARTNSAVKLPQHFMDGGILYQPTPNIQLDLRAGFGLGDHPTDFFAGAGLSFRY
ncbi:transporter [Tautonia plasticadhaerens]|uniref:Transporter n=1 Tax=Tautonia plasticadhaerens TaxID=2527974 RepID=A0A518GXG9_9BACT|nr:transporter [Tautonia plasticadhaerens]QDV33288.1 hypothetical protein ElP_11310 [Tautonia plasticadhaerens]